MIAELTPPPGGAFNLEGGSPALSPDGRTVAFSAADRKGTIALWVRSLDSLEARALKGTDGAQYPFWSPDSQEIGYFAVGRLHRIRATGESPVTLAEAPMGGGGTWSREGTIFFVAQANRGISSVSISGGQASLVVPVDLSRFRVCAAPQILPDGRHLLFRATGRGRASAGTYFAATDGKEERLLVNEESDALYIDGFLLYHHGDTLLARRFDPDHGLFTGDPQIIAEGLAGDPWLRVFDASQNGLLIFQKKGVATNRIRIFDRSGRQSDVVGDEGDFYDLRLSPNGHQLAANSNEFGSIYSGIWVSDLNRHVQASVATEAGIDHGVPVWSPDGTEVAFGLLEGNEPLGIYIRRADGSGQNQMMLAAGGAVEQIWPTSWSRDGRYILYTRGSVSVEYASLWLLPLSGDRQPRCLLKSSKSIYDGQFSPDGQWIAYTSQESGKPEVYLASFDEQTALQTALSTADSPNAVAGKLLVSTDGGRAPRWRGDGKELFYLSQANQVMAAELDHSSGRLKVARTKPLFQADIRLYSFAPFDVSANGDRFVINTLSEPRTPFALIENWEAMLSKH